MDEFERIRQILRGEAPPEGDFSDPCHLRLLDALRSREGAGGGDLACLVRHVLRREDERQRITNGEGTLDLSKAQTLKVPRTPPWPEPPVWERCGVEIIEESPDHYLVRAKPWSPNWLEHSSQMAPEAAAYGEEERRNFEPAEGDYFLSEMDLPEYLSVGQREAVRAALTAPPGSTLVVNLPTGAGKSLCAHLPALLLSKRQGVSVVIVPTTALAMDQERAVAKFVGHYTAYYSDGSEEGQKRRTGIAQRIRDGTQRIVFTSPESVIGALSGPLYDAARDGHLRMLVIDEAHTVDQWGGGFRSDFQVLPGIRRDLLREAIKPFITLLLSATITETCLDTLESLFREPGPFEIVSAVQLRPEPSYWSSECDNWQVKNERVLEAFGHLPRPLILYTTKIADAKRFGDLLRQHGHRRLAVVTSKTPAAERRRLIDDWRARKIDAVVATAAFGLGVDQREVRAVMHVCVPETLDRFYQEVGRGGRDGCASVSLALYTFADLETARRMNRETYIGVERGLQRWERMFRNKKVLDGEQYRVRIDTTPGLRARDIDMRNQLNRQWNLRTLTLIGLAGLIEMGSEPPPAPPGTQVTDPALRSEVYRKALQDYRQSRVVRVRHEQHLEQETWAEVVEPLRRRLQGLATRNLELMEEALLGQRCIADCLAEAYRIAPREGPRPRAGVFIGRACCGCAYCRARGDEPDSGIMPDPSPAWRNSMQQVMPALSRLLGGATVLPVFYDRLPTDPFAKARFDRMLQLLIGLGVRSIVGPGEIVDRLRRGDSLDAFVFLFRRYDRDWMPCVPTLVVHPRGENLSQGLLSPRPVKGGGVPRVVLLPSDTPDPTAPHRRLADLYEGRQYRFEAFLLELGI